MAWARAATLFWLQYGKDSMCLWTIEQCTYSCIHSIGERMINEALMSYLLPYTITPLKRCTLLSSSNDITVDMNAAGMLLNIHTWAYMTWKTTENDSGIEAAIHIDVLYSLLLNFSISNFFRMHYLWHARYTVFLLIRNSRRN